MRLRGYEFTEPKSITTWDAPYRAAVYAIVRPGSEPNKWVVLYFGESGNLSKRDVGSGHHKYDCWLREAGSEVNIFVAYHAMPNSTDEERREVEEDLIRQGKPPCND
jgi:hypothetical protein